MRNHHEWSRAGVAVLMAGSFTVVVLASQIGGIAASALVSGWALSIVALGIFTGADTRDGRDWGAQALKPLKSIDRLVKPLYVDGRLEEPSMEGADMNPILAAELARARMKELQSEAQAGRMRPAARPRWRRAVGARLVRTGVRLAGGWNAPARPELAAALVRPEC